jgi:hypothetical protein
MCRRAAVLPIIAALLVAACGVAEGPREKLKHTAFMFNEGLRWGRYQEVLPRIDPAARDHFMELHKEWGTTIRLSSVEPVQYVIDEDNEKAAVTVQFTWYRIDEMVEHVTQTVQHWERRDGEWLMIAEQHVSGEPF